VIDLLLIDLLLIDLLLIDLLDILVFWTGLISV